MDHDHFVPLLESVLASDTARVKAATSTLKKEYYISPQSLVWLIQLMTDNANPQLRQLAATQARALVPRHWGSVPENVKPGIRNHLLEFTLREQTSLVRHAEARVISAIAKLDIQDGEWTDLPTTLMRTAATSADAHEREVSTYILFTILETIGEDLTKRYPDLFALYERTIQDPQSAEVRINSMLALTKIATMLDPDDDEPSLEAFHKALPSMVAILKQAIDGGDEDRTTQAFEVFQDLLDSDPRLLSVHFRDLVQFMMHLASDRSYEKDVRSQALNFLINTVMCRKLKFQGLRVGEQLTLHLLEILTESQSDVDDDDGFSLTLLALSLLNIMSTSLPPSQIVVPLLDKFKKYAASPDPRQRQAVIAALAAVVEGAPDFVDTQLPELIPIILHLLDDSEVSVREAACDGTTRLAEHLSETMAKNHKDFINLLVNNLNRAMTELNGPEAKTNTTIVVDCCTGLDSLVNGLDQKEVTPYLPGLVPHLSHLFSHPEMKIKGSAVGAVGSIAKTAKNSFQPYFEDTMNALSEFVTIKENDEDLSLRSMAIDAMGNIAIAVGPEAFQRYVQPLLQATEEGLHLDNTGLKETGYMLWATLAKVYGPDFKTFLPGITQSIFACLEQQEEAIEVGLGPEAEDLVGKEVIIGGRKVKVVDLDDDNNVVSDDSDADGDDDDDDDDDSDDGDWEGVSILEEQEVALEALGDIMSHTKAAFVPYLAKSVDMIIPLLDSSYEAVRRASIGTLYRAYATVWALQDEHAQKWQPGLPLKVEPNEDILKLGALVMKHTVQMWPGEDDSGVVLEINGSLSETLKLCGPAIVSDGNNVEVVAETLLSIIKCQHPCQIEDDSPDDDDLPEESSEDDWYMIDSAFDTVMTLAAAIGPRFEPLWKQFEKPLLKYASSSEARQRSAAVGTIADVIRGMGSLITPYTSSILKVLLHRMHDEDSLTRSNAAFAVGLLIENSSDDRSILKAYNTVLTRLEPLLQEPVSRQLDNAAGCVSRMILKHQDHVPIAQVLPKLVELLPLKEDFEENEPVFRMICQLYSSREPVILELTQQVLPVLAHVLSPPEEQLQETTREQLTQLVKFIHQNKADWLQHYPVLVHVAES